MSRSPDFVLQAFAFFCRRSHLVGSLRTSFGAFLLPITAVVICWNASGESQAGVIYTVEFTAALAEQADTLLTIPASSFDLAFKFDSASIDPSGHVYGSDFTDVSLASTDFTAADFNSASSLLDLNGVSLPASGASPLALVPGGGTEFDFSNSAGPLSRELKIFADSLQVTYSQSTESGPHVLTASTNQVTWGPLGSSAVPEPTSLAIWSVMAAGALAHRRRDRGLSARN